MPTHDTHVNFLWTWVTPSFIKYNTKGCAKKDMIVSIELVIENTLMGMGTGEENDALRSNLPNIWGRRNSVSASH